MAKGLKSLKDKPKCRRECGDIRGVAFMARAAEFSFALPFYSLLKALDTPCRQGVREI